MSFEAKRKIEVGGEALKASVPRTEPYADLREQVEQEIRDHDRWCGGSDSTFLPDAYRHARLVRGYSKEQVQSNYDLCHIFR